MAEEVNALERRNLKGFHWTESYVGHVLFDETARRDVARITHAGDGIWFGTFDLDASRRIQKYGSMEEVAGFLEALAGAAPITPKEL